MNVPVNTVCVIVSIIFYKNMVQIFYVRFKYLGKTTATEDLSLFFFSYSLSKQLIQFKAPTHQTYQRI